MIKKIIFSLGIDVLPGWLIFQLSIVSGLIGALNAFLFTTAVSGFITAHLMAFFPEAIALSGITGIILYTLHNYFRKSVSTQWHAIYFYGIVLILMILPFIVKSVSLNFWLFILWFPVTIVSEQVFLSIAVKIPIVKDYQNLKRFLEAGVIAGTALFSFIITLFTLIRIKIPVFYPGIILPLLIIGFFIYIRKNLGNSTDDTPENEEIDSLTNFLTDLPMKKTILILIAFSILSVLTFVFIDYTFMFSLDIIYTDEHNLMQFLGFFLGSLMIVTLFFKLFVYQNLIKTFRIGKAIISSPLILFLMLLSLNILTFFPRHFDLHNPFSLALLCIVFGRFFAYLLRESFEVYSLRLVLSALETFGKKKISKNIISLLTLWSFLFGGLVLLFIKSFEIHSYKTILQLNAGFALAWIFVAWWLARKYQRAIERIIETFSKEYHPNEGLKQKNFKDRVMLTTNLSGLRYLLNYQRNYQPYNFQKTIELIPDTVQDKLGLNSLENYMPYSATETFTGETNPSGDQLHFYDSDESSKVKIIEVLATSPKVKDRIRAVRMIENSKERKYTEILKMLLRDQDDEVKRNAILAVSVYHNASLINELIDLLNDEEFADLVADIFAVIGSDALESLKIVFHRIDIDFKTQSRIVKVIGKISCPDAVSFLLDNLNYPNKWLVLEIVKALIDIKHKSGLPEKIHINNAIINTIGSSAWLLAMEVSLEKMHRSEPVRKAIEEEYEVTLDLLFYLLQLKYSDGIILQAKDYLVTNSENEQRELSVELLDYILEDELKGYLFPLLHNNQKKEKVKQLQQLYPISVKPEDQALREIINADLGNVSLWTKACALHAYIHSEAHTDMEDIYAQAFNPDPLLNELAFTGLYRLNKENLKELYERLPANQKKQVRTIMQKGKNFEHQLLFNKVLFLQGISVFEKVKGHHLIPFAEILKEHYLTQENPIFISCSEEDVLPVFTVSYGEVSLIDLQKRSYRLNRNYLYGLGLYAGGITLNTFSEAIVYMAEPEQIGTLVINHEELSDALFKYIQNSNFY